MRLTRSRYGPAVRTRLPSDVIGFRPGRVLIAAYLTRSTIAQPPTTNGVASSNSVISFRSVFQKYDKTDDQSRASY